jgi:hypothetical protein
VQTWAMKDKDLKVFNDTVFNVLSLNNQNSTLDELARKVSGSYEIL